VNNIDSSDQSFLDGLYQTIEYNLLNEQFGVVELARDIGVSRSQLHRKLRELTGQSASQVIREYRLNKAKDLLEKKAATVAEVSYQVGFGSPSYFNTCFHDFFGYPPGEVKIRKSFEEKKKPLITKKVAVIAASILAVLALIYYSVNLNGITKEEIPKPLILEKSIAVLAFKDMSPEQDQEYLGDGIAEEIINQLTKVKGLKVIGRTSSFSFKGKDTDIKTIGELLGVEMVLEGSVMKSGNQLRITAKLINAKDCFQIWSERYDKPFTEVLALQDEITRSVVSRINENLVLDKGKSNDIYETISPEAYETYLKGELVKARYYKKWQKEDFELADTFYKNAIILDSNFALPHLSLSDMYASCLISLEFVEDNQLRQKLSDLGIYYLNKGYALNPNNEIANVAKANWFWANGQNSEIDSAYYYFKKALVINPKNADILRDFAFFYQTRMGFNEQALFLCSQAIDIDPLNIEALCLRGYIYTYSLSDFDKAEPDLEEALNLSPDHYNSIWTMFLLNALKGNYQETLVYLSKIHESPSDQLFLANFPFFCDSVTNALFAYEGNEKLVPNLQSKYWGYMPPTIFMSLDMYEEQLGYLEKLVINNPYKSYYPILSKNQLLEPIRDTPRFQKLLEINRIRHQELEAKYGNLDFLDL